MKEIHEVRNLLFGVNCITGQTGDRICREWESRFSKASAFMTDADNGESCEQIADKLCRKLEKQGFRDFSNRVVILVVFYDMRQEMPKAVMDELKKLPAKLNYMLKCNIAMELQFIDVGRIGRIDNQKMRAMVAHVSEENRNVPHSRHMILMAEPALSTNHDKVWRSVITLLDLIRCDTNPHDLLPDLSGMPHNSAVGYLGYGECDPEALQQIEAKLQQLKSKFREEDLTLFREQFASRTNRLRSDILSDMNIDGALQPLHPDMEIPEGKGFLGLGNKREKARKGKLQSFEEARQKTVDALEETARDMKREINKRFAKLNAQADQLLIAALEESGLSITCKADSDRTEEMLVYHRKSSYVPNPPELKYDEKGYAEDIGRYLEDVRNDAIEEGYAEFYRSLLKTFKGLPEDHFDILREEKEREAALLNEEKYTLRSPEDFCRGVFHGNTGIISEFALDITAVKSKTWVVAHGKSMQDLVEEISVGNIVADVCKVDDNYDGVRKAKKVKIEALRVVMSQCTDSTLTKLFPEV